MLQEKNAQFYTKAVRIVIYGV